MISGLIWQVVPKEALGRYERGIEFTLGWTRLGVPYKGRWIYREWSRDIGRARR